ncbi:MAG: hypothetical protein ACIAQF_13925 [Phycisphaerales bacterium JB065]
MTQTFSRRLSHSTIASRSVLCSLLAGLTIGLSGCEDSSVNYAQQLEDARDQMRALASSTENQESQIEQVIAKLNDAMRSVEGDAKAPAQLMIASANSDLAEIRLNLARQIASRISLDLTRADSVAREYSSNRAYAMTLVGPDAGEAIRTIEAEIRTVDAEVRALQVQRQELSAELAGVQNEISQLMQAARTERLQEADLRDEAIDAAPMRRSELIAQSVEHSRAAESKEKTAAELELTVDSLKQAIAQVDQIIENQQAIRAIHTQGLERISMVDSELNQRRAERNAVTSQTLKTYRSQLETILEQFRTEFAPVALSAAEGYASAASTARQARSMGTLATTAAGEHAADAARAHELRAQTARRIVSSASYMIDINADDRSFYQNVRSEFEGIATEAETLAAESFDEAAAALSSIDENLSENYASRARALRGEPATPADQPDPMGADDASAGDPTQGGE